MAKRLLTNKRAAHAKKVKRTGVMRGGKLAYPAGVAARYKARLDSLVLKMTRKTGKQLEQLFTAEQFGTQDASVASQSRILLNSLWAEFQSMFDGIAKAEAERMVNSADRASKAATYSSLKELSGGLSIKTDVLSAAAKETLKASVVENVALIKSIPSQYFDQITQATMRSITSGKGLAELQPQIKKYEGITERRADLIATDQTRKAYSAMNRDRMAAVGITKAEWIHSGGGSHPRETHVALDGTIYDVKKGAYDPAVGEWIQPGFLINCRCSSRPVIEFNEGEVVDE